MAVLFVGSVYCACRHPDKSSVLFLEGRDPTENENFDSGSKSINI